MSAKVVIVTEDDRVVDVQDRLQAHLGQGMLHRAFMVLIFNRKGELLIQKRGQGKMLWPLHWENSCSSHPSEDEGQEEAGQRRVREELGFTCSLRAIGTVRYQATYKDVGAENEVCAVLVGRYDGPVVPDCDEVADWKWISPEELRQDIADNPAEYAPWLALGLECYLTARTQT